MTHFEQGELTTRSTAQWPPDTRPDGISEFRYTDTRYQNVHIEKYAAERVLRCVKSTLINLYIAF